MGSITAERLGFGDDLTPYLQYGANLFVTKIVSTHANINYYFIGFSNIGNNTGAKDEGNRII
jgi:hypothetical protein